MAVPRTQLGEPTSPLIVTGERIVRAEFPKQLQAADVLASIGSGERTWTNISEEAGVQAGALDRALDILTKKKRIVRAALPHVPERSKETRYFIDDTVPKILVPLPAPEPGRD